MRDVLIMVCVAIATGFIGYVWHTASWKSHVDDHLATFTESISELKENVGRASEQNAADHDKLWEYLHLEIRRLEDRGSESRGKILSRIDTLEAKIFEIKGMLQGMTK